jgi:hypothetical protein
MKRAFVLLMLAGAVSPAFGQARFYAGAVGGVATLSADARAVTNPMVSLTSLYKPENGATFNVFAGYDATEYLSFQGNYIRNENDLTLTAAAAGGPMPVFYEQTRQSRQHSVIGDALVYFRERDQKVRPYLSGGLGLVHLTSSPGEVRASAGGAMPPGSFSATLVGLRVAVGMDVRLGGGWKLRYSFSETISRNPISRELMPMAERRLANFQNLVGILRYF